MNKKFLTVTPIINEYDFKRNTYSDGQVSTLTFNIKPTDIEPSPFINLNFEDNFNLYNEL